MATSTATIKPVLRKKANLKLSNTTSIPDKTLTQLCTNNARLFIYWILYYYIQ